MTNEELRRRWESEERCAQIRGWDFSHLDGRCVEEGTLPWSYEAEIRRVLRREMKLLDIDTGGGEFLLSLGHPPENTSATEGYAPNVRLCRERLVPLGIDLRECSDVSRLPFEESSFDLIINRHGSFDPREIRRVLRPGGGFITQQVGSENDRDLVEAVLPGTKPPFPEANLRTQRRLLEDAGLEVLCAQEAFLPIRFYDIGAFVWFARIIEWEFPGFSVKRCYKRLLQMQDILEQKGSMTGTIHRFFMKVRKPEAQADAAACGETDG
jgi:SAM-dependent methyltransferase